MNGAVAPQVANHFMNQGVDVVPFDRSKVDISSEAAIAKFIESEKPNFFLHLATGPAEWAEVNAKLSHELGIKFLFTSTVSVFSETGSGPYTVDSNPDAEDDYGKYKRDCEQRIKKVNPDALIARLGWQIGHATGSNNMFDFLERTMAEKGFIEASESWYPSCSFLEDTAETLFDLTTKFSADTYLLNSNLNINFYEIVCAINKKANNWKVVSTNNLVRDDRMFDERVSIKKLTEKLDF